VHAVATRTDPRDAPIGEALDRAVAEVDPDVDASLPRVVERGRRLRVRRMVATALVAALIVSGLGWLRFQFRPHRLQASLDVDTWMIAGSPERGWHLRYPVGWNVQDLGDRGCRSRGISGGILVTNIDVTLHHPDGRITGCWDRWVLADFPEAGVGVQVQPAPPPRFPGDLRGELPDTAFPISVEDLRFTGRVLGGPSTRSLRVVRGGRETLVVTLFVGRRAPDHDLEVARSLVRTIGLVRPGIRWRTAGLGAGSVVLRAPSGHGWRTRPISGACQAHPYRGLLVANVEVPWKPGGDPCAGAVRTARRLPPQGVVVAVAMQRGGTPPVDHDDQLSVDPAVWTSEAPPDAEGTLRPVVTDGFRLSGRTFMVTVWFGEDATLGSRLVARHVVGSIRAHEPGMEPADRTTG
jgi:hypothetical protein